jgi:hypothetical protein
MKLVLILLLFSQLGSLSAFAESVNLPVRAATLQLSQLLANERERRDGTLWYREAAVIELLQYRKSMIESAANEGKPFDFNFHRHRTLKYIPETKTLSYQAPTISVDVVIASQDLKSTVTRRNWFGVETKKETIMLSLANITSDSLKEWSHSLQQLVRVSRGYQDHLFAPAVEPDSLIDPNKPQETWLDIHEKWADDQDFDRTPWQYVPVKLVSWPLQKLFYDLPAMATSIATESVMHSPWHNLLGAWDEFRGALKLSKNAFQDIAVGIRDRGNGRSVDGVLELMDASLKLGNSVTGIVKAGVSTVAYPVFRSLGGKKSQRVALRGKRAVIVLIDSAAGSEVSTAVVDTYGEEIIRSKLKSISDYYCVRSRAHEADIEQCIRNIPNEIQYLDIISLQHTGGMAKAEKYMKMAVQMKNVKPELLLSIGCYDSASTKVEAENTMGQERSSWAVHYYLANMIEKRLRGSSAIDAASEAYGESFATNAIDPVSWGAVLLIGTTMEDRLVDGYLGSRPSLLTPNSLVRKTLMEVEQDWNSYVMFTEKRMQLSQYHQKIDRLLAEGKIKLRKNTLAMLEKSKRKLAGFVTTN